MYQNVLRLVLGLIFYFLLGSFLNGTADAARSKPYASFLSPSQLAQLAHFNSDTAFIADVGIDFDPPGIEKTMKVLSEGDNHQITFTILNPNLTNLSAQPMGNLANYPHTLKVAGSLCSNFILEEISKRKKIPFLTIVPNANSFTYAEVLKMIPPKVIQNISLLLQNLARSYLIARGPAYHIGHGKLMLRTTSNTMGHRITRGHFGDREAGLHVHHHGVPETIEFVWTIHGAGTVSIVDHQLIQASDGQVLIFGDNIPHGSPDSDDLRLIGVGYITLMRR